MKLSTCLSRTILLHPDTCQIFLSN